MPRLRADRSTSYPVVDSDNFTPPTPPRRIFFTLLISSREIVTLVFIATFGLLCLSSSRESSLHSASRNRVRSERKSLRVALRSNIRRGTAPTATKNASLLELCDTHFGQNWLQRWDAAGVDLCSPRGMHGAAMAWTLIMPSHAAAVELWPGADGVWRCYEHTSHWAGLQYRRWANADPSKASTREGSDYTHVEVTALRLILEPLVT
ncbi:hypothetical protein COCOBI_05-6610 [Coccomyxa sp. Obi]|nr:hypothetical protein COCOBI_05-6610 [Coccomyxa sp. Obi]